MAVDYRSFSNKQFLFELNGIMVNNGLFFKRDKAVKESWKAKNVTAEIPNTWELVYSVPCDKPWFDLIVYSSVDAQTKHTRDVGKDAVRIVQRWHSFDGSMVGYRAVHFNPNSKTKRHNRLETMFQNIEKTLVAYMKVTDVNKNQFVWVKKGEAIPNLFEEEAS